MAAIVFIHFGTFFDLFQFKLSIFCHVEADKYKKSQRYHR